MEVPGKRTDVVEKENAGNIDFSCEPCQSNNTMTASSGFCKDCEEYMCNACFRQHLNLKLCKHHVLVNGDHSTLSFKRKDKCTIRCKQHNGETVKFYCRTHEVVGCGDCIILEHKTCQVEYIQDLADNFQQNKEYTTFKENIENVISNRKCFEKEIQDKKTDNMVMLEKALGDIRQFRLDINEYLDREESDIISKVECIMRKNETLLTKLENNCKTLSIKLGKVAALLNSELFEDNDLFIHTVECKPLVSESEVALADLKSKTIQKYEFVPDQQFRSLLATGKSLGTVAISTMNVCPQSTATTNYEDAIALSQNEETQFRFRRLNKKKSLGSETEICGDNKVTNSEDSAYEDLYLSTRKIENVTDQVWQIMQVERKDKIDEFQKLGGVMKHEMNTLSLNLCSGGQETDDGMFDDYFNVFKAFVRDLENMEFEDIPIDECHFTSIPSWQSEIDNTFKRKCCSFIPNEKKLIVYCETFEDVKRVEHHYLVKQGKKGRTERRRKGLAADDSGPTSLDPEHETSLAVRKTDNIITKFTILSLTDK